MRKGLKDAYLQTDLAGNGKVASGFGGLSVGYQTRHEIWIGRRSSGKIGSGSQIDPLAGNSNAGIQAIFDDLPAGYRVNFTPEDYGELQLTINKEMELVGNRDVIFRQATGVNKPIFVLTGTGVITMRGFSMIHGAIFREEENVTAIKAGASVHVYGVFASDFNNVFWLGDAWGTCFEAIFSDCDFVYTHGRASISNTATYDHPCSPIVGHSNRLIVRGNRFNAITDPEFTDVAGSPPASQLTPADNAVQTGGHDYCVVEGNDFENFAIEGINLNNDDGVMNDRYYRVANNHLTGPPVKSGFYAVTNPGLRLGDLRNVAVSGNTIRNFETGVLAVFTTANEANKVYIENNTILDVLRGVNAVNTSSFSVIQGNTIRSSSSPVHEVLGDSASLASTTELYGIICDNGEVKDNILIAEMPTWDATVTLNSRAGAAFTLDDASDLTADVGALISHSGDTFSIFPILGIVGNVVTVENDYSIAYPGVTSGTLYYTKSFANPFSTGGIVVQNGGHLEVSGNIIIGHRYDLNPLGSGGTMTVRNHTVRNVVVVRPEQPPLFVREGMWSINGEAHAYHVEEIEQLATSTQPGRVSAAEYKLLESDSRSPDNSVRLTFTTSGLVGDGSITVLGGIGYVLGTGDVFEYSIRYDAANSQFAGYPELYNGTTALGDDAAFEDEDGVSLRDESLHELALGRWVRRRLPIIAADVGQTIDQLWFRIKTGDTGNFGADLRDVRIVNGDTVMKVLIDETTDALGTMGYGSNFAVTLAIPGFRRRLSTLTELRIGPNKVVGVQGAAIADATDATDVITQLNLALAALRTHGLIAT